jgi:hypothetical protein
MKSILDHYLDRVLIYANLPERKAEAIRKELNDHLLQKVDDLAKSGLSHEEATLEALHQHGSPKLIGYNLRGAFPWIDIRSQGTARGFIAIGPRAVGIFAFGGFAVGVVACGASSVGLVSAGGLSLGLLCAWAGFGMGGIVAAGFALGIVATGGFAVGAVVDGARSIGAWTPQWGLHAGAISHYTAQNVPAVLKSLEPLLIASVNFSRYFAVITPIYLLACFALTFVQYHEKKRVTSADDWLIDG